MDKLRTAGPWESEQTHDSLRRYLLEETYELFDAVRGGNADELRDELGDVLLQVLFHARIAEEAPANRSPSTTSPTRWCASSATGCPPCWPVSRSRWKTSWPSGKQRKAAEETGEGGRSPAWTTCRPVSPRWRWRRR